MKELLMGNEAVALGALAAGVQVVCGYPGTPSTEALETIAKRNPGNVYVEWSVNEKAGAEVAAGAAYCGARSLVTMKQMGLNVAADPVMCVSYVGVKGGMVIYVADDPGPISSQTEQDTRTFGLFSRIPVLDCASPEAAFRLVQDAFELSEKHQTPVILRSTTRVCHSCAVIDVPEIKPPARAAEFEKDPKWVIFPKLSYENKIKITERERTLSREFSEYSENSLTTAGMRDAATAASPSEAAPAIKTAHIQTAPAAGAQNAATSIEDEQGAATTGNALTEAAPAAGAQRAAERPRIGIACGGISCAYAADALGAHAEEFAILQIATPYPFPDELAERFLRSVDQIIVLEELDPYIEDQLIGLCGKTGLRPQIFGKRSGDVPVAGELDALTAAEIISRISGKDLRIAQRPLPENKPEMPVRPPVLCAGCPHRGAFYAVKTASGGRGIYCGDIGCYTLGNAQPLDMVDTCLCMGAGITMAQGIARANADKPVFAFVGDSTFFASGITGVVNAVYNQAEMILCVLDNSTTAMTGHQPHPGMGRTMMGEMVPPVDIAKVLEGIGVASIRTVDPLDLEASVSAVRSAMEEKGVRAILFKSPCIALVPPKGLAAVDPDRCIGCMNCIEEIGCPALITRDGKAFIDQGTCNGCGLCTQICPADAILVTEKGGAR